MNKFKGYDKAKEQAQKQGSAKLPAGAYVCKIMSVKYEKSTDDRSDLLLLQIDIHEGDYKSFFFKKYEDDTSEDKKWKGMIRVYVPTDDGSEKDDWTKRNFAGWIDAIEKSNPGYLWDWDENKLKGKLIGVVFGETGTVIDGRQITYTEPRFGVDIVKVRDGSAPKAKFKEKNGYSATTKEPTVDANGFMQIPDGVEDEIPF